MFGLALGTITVAHAACPALDMENTWLAMEAQWRLRGLSSSQVDAFVRQGVAPRYPVTLWPPSGPAPLAVGLIWQGGRDPRAESIEVDLDGNGTIDLADAREDNIGHTYSQPGHYAAKIRIRWKGGEASTFDAPVSVLTPSAFEAELQGRWTALKMALQRGSILDAFECIFSMERSPRHEHLLRGVPRGQVDEYLPPIRFVGFIVTEARYQSVRPRPGATRPMEVRFHPDLDGVWRVNSILPEMEP
jgi:hypothetical protein